MAANRWAASPARFRQRSLTHLETDWQAGQAGDEQAFGPLYRSGKFDIVDARKQMLEEQAYFQTGEMLAKACMRA